METGPKMLSIWGWLVVLAVVVSLAGILLRQIVLDEASSFDAELKQMYSRAARHVNSVSDRGSDYVYIDVRPYPEINPLCLPYLKTEEGKRDSQRVAVAYSDYQNVVGLMVSCFVIASLLASIPVFRVLLRASALAIGGVSATAAESKKAVVTKASRVIDGAYDLHVEKLRKAKEKAEAESEESAKG
jgi:hypothetical protein